LFRSHFTIISLWLTIDYIILRILLPIDIIYSSTHECGLRIIAEIVFLVSISPILLWPLIYLFLVLYLIRGIYLTLLFANLHFPSA